MPIALVAIAAVEVGVAVVGMIQSKNASDNAAATSKATATYNSKVDLAQASQVDQDTQANIANMRQNASVYMSKQQSSFVAAGVVANKGSALAVQAETAGKFAQKEQQTWNESQNKEQLLASDAQAGVAYGNADADAYHAQGVASVMSGAGKIAGIAGNAYAGGAFSFGGTGPQTAAPTFDDPGLTG